ncbi:hypothetical protein, partial [Pseudomonas savastanoi]|uniref:hypothetical protein n=1 Tax=Pseudomonas savastanoi TaxID=29438 RepID=UPI001C0FD628
KKRERQLQPQPWREGSCETSQSSRFIPYVGGAAMLVENLPQRKAAIGHTEERGENKVTDLK